jgi:hypothetical protein
MSTGAWTLIADDLTEVQIEYIEEGFSSEIMLSGHSITLESGQEAFFDDGADYDKYKSKFSCVMEASQLSALETQYNNNRDKIFVLTPTDGGSGFALFTPAYGGEGDFPIKILNVTQSGTLDATRYQWFRVVFEVASVLGLPPYSPQLGNDEGTLQIGTIGGLRYPVGGFNPKIEYDVGGKVTSYLKTFVNDWGSQSEKTKFKLELLHDKMSLLIKHLLSVRYDEVDIIVQSGSYPFGASQGDNKTFTSRLISKKLVVTQTINKRYQVELEFQRVV